jgi:hypothetical protein
VITTEYLLDWVRAHPLPDKRIIPVCLWGEAGIGKTAWINGYCRQRNIGFQVYYPAHDSTGADIVGLPYIDIHTERTMHARPTWLRSDEDAVQFDRQGIIFIDEINRALKPVLRGLMEPLGEGRIAHSGWKLGEKWSFVCAANPPGSAYEVEVLDEALMNRLLHVPMGFDVVRWSAWAGETSVHPDLVAFTAQYPTIVASLEQGLPAGVEPTATPRTIEYLARLYEPGMSEDLLSMLAKGLIGDSAAAQFITYVKNPERPVSAEEVLTGDDFIARIAAHRAQQRDDLLDASQTLMLAMLVRYRSSPEAAARVARYMQALGDERSRAVWKGLSLVAPHWKKALTEAAPARTKRSAKAPGAASR